MSWAMILYERFVHANAKAKTNARKRKRKNKQNENTTGITSNEQHLAKI